MKAINVIEKYSKEIDLQLNDHYVTVLSSLYTLVILHINDSKKNLEFEKCFKYIMSKSSIVDVNLFESAGREVDYKLLEGIDIPYTYPEIYELIKTFLETEIDDNFKKVCEFTIQFNSLIKLIEPFMP